MRYVEVTKGRMTTGLCSWISAHFGAGLAHTISFRYVDGRILRPSVKRNHFTAVPLTSIVSLTRHAILYSMG